jgi:hypothetical protein
MRLTRHPGAGLLMPCVADALVTAAGHVFSLFRPANSKRMLARTN